VKREPETVRRYYMARLKFYMREYKGDSYKAADEAEKDTRQKFGKDVEIK
jgi:hypothetical protein